MWIPIQKKKACGNKQYFYLPSLCVYTYVYIKLKTDKLSEEQAFL